MVVVSHHPYSPNPTPCDFFCTHGWSKFWNGGVLLTLQRFNENRWQPLTAFLLKILDNVSSSGRIAGIAASSHSGSTWKGTEVLNLYEYFKYMFVTMLEILGSHPHMRIKMGVCTNISVWKPTVNSLFQTSMRRIELDLLFTNSYMVTFGINWYPFLLGVLLRHFPIRGYLNLKMRWMSYKI